MEHLQKVLMSGYQNVFGCGRNVQRKAGAWAPGGKVREKTIFSEVLPSVSAGSPR
jgi:hypothetical protein